MNSTTGEIVCLVSNAEVT